MTRKLLFAFFAGVFAFSSLSHHLNAQEERSDTSEDRLVGKVQKVDRPASKIHVTYGNVRREVIYDESTRFTVSNRAGSLDAVKEGREVICRGKFDSKDRLIASRIEVPYQKQ